MKTAPEIDLSQKDILIVDDTATNIRILSQMLTKNGYNVRKALNGQMALTACQTVLPDLILLDIMMLDMDGYEVCQRLKADQKTAAVPIIFISALDEVLDKVKAFKVGGVDYITKPFQLDEVLVRIKNQLTIQQLYNQLIQKNQKLQQLNEELIQTNTELEQFAAIASHDLQSPLQGIVTNAELLKLKSKNSLDSDAFNRINRIVDGGMRMKQLINDLLAYSRLGRQPPEFQLIDCQTPLEDAIANLQTEICSSCADIQHFNLPQVMGDRTQLMRLFQNLINNAIKFRHAEVKPIIKISAEAQKDNVWLIGIHDNGIGIAPENFERIFEVFKRLHTAQEYPGTGIGMSICKKIVEYHGGRIWLESQLGVGTSFYFTIPAIK